MTNGEKLKETFPNIDSRLFSNTGIMLVKWGDDTTKCFKASWWGSEYKEPITKNDLVTLTFSKGTLKYSCKDYVVYKKDWLRSHYGAEIDIMFGDSQYKEPIIDKIRAEIAELSHYYPMGHDYQIAITRCIAVIDKYKEAADGNI